MTDLFLLVGSNPLPNYIAALYHIDKKSVTRVYLLHSDVKNGSTEAVANRLKTHIEAACNSSVEVIRHPISNPFCPKNLYDKFKEIIGDSGNDWPKYFHYTGGTKAMCVEFFRAWSEAWQQYYQETQPAERPKMGDYYSYLDDQAQCIRFASTENASLMEKQPIPIATLWALHDDKTTLCAKDSYSPCASMPTIDHVISFGTLLVDDAPLRLNLLKDGRLARLACSGKGSDYPLLASMWQGWCADERKIPEIIKAVDACEDCALFQEVKYNTEKSKFRDETCMSQRTLMLPDTEGTDILTKTWGKFLRGEWLEMLVFWRLQQVFKGAQHSTVFHTIKPQVSSETDDTKPKQDKFEIDIVAQRGYRNYAISCTTDGSMSRCKLKIFELLTRAEQLAGGMVRCALVCLAEKNTRDRLESTVRKSWGSHLRFQVFGADDVRDWLRNGSLNLSALEHWLDVTAEEATACR